MYLWVPENWAPEKTLQILIVQRLVFGESAHLHFVFGERRKKKWKVGDKLEFPLRQTDLLASLKNFTNLLCKLDRREGILSCGHPPTPTSSNYHPGEKKSKDLKKKGSFSFIAKHIWRGERGGHLLLWPPHPDPRQLASREKTKKGKIQGGITHSIFNIKILPRIKPKMTTQRGSNFGHLLEHAKRMTDKKP